MYVRAFEMKLFTWPTNYLLRYLSLKKDNTNVAALSLFLEAVFFFFFSFLGIGFGRQTAIVQLTTSSCND